MSSLQPFVFLYFFCFLQPQSGLAFLHLLQVVCGAEVTGHAGPVTTGICSCEEQGQAAITGVKEHVDIPTAIAAANVSFLMDIFTSLFVPLPFKQNTFA
jgi:hypothetical protein